MAASAASPAHQGRLVLAAVLAGGLIVLGLIVARKFLSSKKKSSTSTEETAIKNEVNEVITQEDVKKVEAIKEESEPEPESEPEIQPEPESEPESQLKSKLIPELASQLECEPIPEPEQIVPVKPEAGDTVSSTLKVELKPSDPEQVHRRGISVSPARLLPSPTPESAPVQEVIESTEVKTTESAAFSASEPETSVTESSSEEPDVRSEEAASSEPTEEPTQENENLAEESDEKSLVAKDVLVKPEESKLDPKAEPFMPRDSSLLQQFTPTDDSIVSEIVASGMGGESLAEPIEKEADLEDLSDDGAVASSEVESENLSAEMEELKIAAAAVVKSGPQSVDFEMHEEPLSTSSNYVVIDPDQANNNSMSPQSSEGEPQLPAGQYDDAEEHQKAAEHDLNSDPPFDFFDLATSPNDFKPSFDFVDPNENLTVQRGSDEDIEVINDQKDLNDEYIPDIVMEDVQVEVPPDYSADDISSALDAANNNPDTIGTRQLEVLVSLILSKDYDIQQAAMAGVIKCAAFTDNQNSLRELGCPKKLAILLKSYVMSTKVGYNVSTALISSVANAVSNMSVNDKNQIVLQETVPLLIDLTLEGDMKESALLSTLRALTNLSTTEQHHGQYTCMVQHLYNLMDVGSTPVKLQALKVLVNLSCSSEMVQHLLAAKAPHSLLELLQQDAEEALVLRWTTLLANIVHTVRVNKMSQSSLPCPDKAASPETMYTAVYGVHSMGDLKSKIFLLSKHKNEDIRYQAARVYSGLVR